MNLVIALLVDEQIIYGQTVQRNELNSKEVDKWTERADRQKCSIGIKGQI